MGSNHRGETVQLKEGTVLSFAGVKVRVHKLKYPDIVLRRVR